MNNGDRQAKLTDFGISKQLEDDATSCTNTNSYTANWASPELLDSSGRRIRKSTDIFSLGCVYYYIITGSHPFDTNKSENMKRRQENIKNGKHQKMSTKILSDTALDLVRNMTKGEPSERYNARDVSHHPTFMFRVTP